MINRAGYNIYSAELEGLLQGLDGVIECAAVARPDPVLGEKIQLFVVSDDPGLSAARLKTYCAEHLADYKIPDFIDFLEEPLPRNANGKVLKAQLRLRISETQTASG
ncbi:AMP-binding enzyme [Alloalcanivorax xenomutans]